ncbi:MAG: hypothetical protein H6624_12655 [Bdellovibrionaceae bacterium]|nr:hypothetical protein [Bdellovibrionales bacterium]MCB9085195.1 hypothetical protein [Pseudobdellovibrionaceae bacterium]
MSLTTKSVGFIVTAMAATLSFTATGKGRLPISKMDFPTKVVSVDFTSVTSPRYDRDGMNEFLIAPILSCAKDISEFLPRSRALFDLASVPAVQSYCQPIHVRGATGKISLGAEELTTVYPNGQLSVKAPIDVFGSETHLVLVWLELNKSAAAAGTIVNWAASEVFKVDWGYNVIGYHSVQIINDENKGHLAMSPTSEGVGEGSAVASYTIQPYAKGEMEKTDQLTYELLSRKTSVADLHDFRNLGSPSEQIVHLEKIAKEIGNEFGLKISLGTLDAGNVEKWQGRVYGQLAQIEDALYTTKERHPDLKWSPNTKIVAFENCDINHLPSDKSNPVICFTTFGMWRNAMERVGHRSWITSDENDLLGRQSEEYYYCRREAGIGCLLIGLTSNVADVANYSLQWGDLALSQVQGLFDSEHEPYSRSNYDYSMFQVLPQKIIKAMRDVSSPGYDGKLINLKGGK